MLIQDLKAPSSLILVLALRQVIQVRIHRSTQISKSNLFSLEVGYLTILIVYILSVPKICLCPNPEKGLVTAYMNLRMVSPYYSSNALYRQISHSDLSLQSPGCTGETVDDASARRVFLLSTPIVPRAVPALAMEMSTMQQIRSEAPKQRMPVTSA